MTSRAFRLRGPRQPAALLPLIDMANHCFDPNAEVVPTGEGVALVAKRQVGQRSVGGGSGAVWGGKRGVWGQGLGGDRGLGGTMTMSI